MARFCKLYTKHGSTIRFPSRRSAQVSHTFYFARSVAAIYVCMTRARKRKKRIFSESHEKSTTGSRCSSFIHLFRCLSFVFFFYFFFSFTMLPISCRTSHWISILPKYFIANILWTRGCTRLCVCVCVSKIQLITSYIFDDSLRVHFGKAIQFFASSQKKLHSPVKKNHTE